MSNTLDRRTAVLVDQHPLWLDTVEQAIASVGVDTLGKCNSAEEGLRAVEELRPDLLITGIEMPAGAMDGVALVRESRARFSQLRVIVLSMYDDFQHIDAAFAAGAAAYVLKKAHPDDLTAAIRQAFEHSIYLAGTRLAPPVATTEASTSPGLTRRELEILQLVAEGHSNAELARMLWVTEQTVKFHLSNIYRKLNVANRTEASRWAQLSGLLTNHPAAKATA
jgi:DNA-binding NarL/FixJ family response regulator